ncbi:protein translocase subunit SecF [Patescibacteria group bacterium]|nr:protein translocase subunit SecF [Patescibacteria group bacterium]
MIRWMHYRLLYAAISGIVIAVGIFSLFKWGLNIGIDFKGGAILEYKFAKQVSEEQISSIVKNAGGVASIQKTGDGSYSIRFAPIDSNQKTVITALLQKNFDAEELRFENVGPTIGPELVKKTVYALLISASAILLWVAYQFKSIKFGTSAVLAMFHDSIVLIGMYSLLGHFFGAEVDFLFVTALLTILSFSVHDTIIVYDRIREAHRKTGGDVAELADKAMTETMVRSLNNSFTIIFMLVALILLGGTTVKWFAAALLIGTISGTYSSPFVAVPILVTWDEIEKKIKRR